MNFTSEEFALMKKNEEGRPLLLEELLEEASQETDLNGLRTSFSAWHQLDERVLAELNKVYPNSKTSLFHQTMVNWFSYHAKLTKQFKEENLSKDQINQLVQQFKKDAEAHNAKLQQSVISVRGLKEILSVFVEQAQAATCGAVVPPPFYHFGGRVILMVPCFFGIVETISPPCGGLLYFSWPVLAGNPYLWKKPTIGSAILGRSLLIPGGCGNLLTCGAPPACVVSVYLCQTCIPYEAAVLYFGTSLTP